MSTIAVESMRSQHLEAAVEIHLQAFRGYMNARLGRRYARAMLRWFMEADSGVALIAADESGRVVGYAVGAINDYTKAMSRALMPVAVTSVLLHPWLLFGSRIRERIAQRVRAARRPANAPVRMPELPRPVLSLIAIGVAAEARGRRVGARLMQAFEERGRALGIRSMRLTVYDHNAPARRLYENAGWTAIEGAGRSELAFIRLLS